MTLTKERESAFLAKINKTPTCWLWTGTTNAAGYAVFSGIGENTGHRVSFRHYKGVIPEDMQMDHLCSNPSCVNPAHLEAVTFSQNHARRKIRMRWRGWPTHCRAGHVMDDHTTYWRPNGLGRQCRICIRARQSEHAIRNGRAGFKLGTGPNGTLKNKHLYELTAEDYEKANLSEWFIEVFYACDNMKRHGERETMAA